MWVSVMWANVVRGVRVLPRPGFAIHSPSRTTNFCGPSKASRRYGLLVLSRSPPTTRALNVVSAAGPLVSKGTPEVLDVGLTAGERVQPERANAARPSAPLENTARRVRDKPGESGLSDDWLTMKRYQSPNAGCRVWGKKPVYINAFRCVPRYSLSRRSRQQVRRGSAGGRKHESRCQSDPFKFTAT